MYTVLHDIIHGGSDFFYCAVFLGSCFSAFHPSLNWGSGTGAFSSAGVYNQGHVSEKSVSNFNLILS